MIPRLMEAKPELLLTDDGSNFDPFLAWEVTMANDKPCRHGERSSPKRCSGFTGRGEALAVDNNGRFDLETALRYSEALAP